MSSTDLEALGPDETRQLYLGARQDELTEDTLSGQDYRIRAFVQWCEEEGIVNLNELDGRDIYQYRVWRREGGYTGEELQNVTLRGDLATIRAFLRFCGDIDAVGEELFTQVPLPQVSHGQGRMSRCPSARSPHDMRSGRVTAYRLQDADSVVVSDRMDASERILDKHYDQRSERQRAAQRREHLEGL